MPQVGLIDGLQFARDGSVLEGELEMGRLGRLAQMQCATSGLRYRLQGVANADGKAYLELSVSGSLQLVCQRCLGRMDFPLRVASRLEVAGEWRDIAQAEDDVDRVLAARDMDVAALMEDEIILALPMVPKHEQCAASADRNDGSAARKSPFGVLAALKKGAADK